MTTNQATPPPSGRTAQGAPDAPAAPAAPDAPAASAAQGAPAASASVPPRWIVRSAWVAHRALVRVTRGRLGYRPASADQWGMLRLHTVGRRSGADRVAILGYIEDGPNLVTLAMNGWGEGEPAWWLNLQAKPDAVVELHDGPRPVRGRAATPEERPRLWARWDMSGNLDAFAARRSGETAVVILEPRAAPGT
jgi:deazaflavin-dependent oxidoreductase (nitroreductase family)